MAGPDKPSWFSRIQKGNIAVMDEGEDTFRKISVI
jgi:hypothetical protein